MVEGFAGRVLDRLGAVMQMTLDENRHVYVLTILLTYLRGQAGERVWSSDAQLTW